MSLDDSAEHVKEDVGVLLDGEHGLPTIPSTGYVVDGSGDVYARRSRHGIHRTTRAIASAAK